MLLTTTTPNGLTTNCQVKLTMMDSNDRRSKDTSLRDPNSHKLTLTHSDPIFRAIAPIGLKSTVARSDPTFRAIVPIGLSLMTVLCDLSAKAISLRGLVFINGQCDPSMRGTSLASTSDQSALRDRCMSLENISDPTALKGRHMSHGSIADQSTSNGSTRGLSLILDRYANLSNIMILGCENLSNIVLSDLN